MAAGVGLAIGTQQLLQWISKEANLAFHNQWKHVNVPDAVREHAEEKTSKLPRYYSGINQVEVVVDGSKGGSLSIEIIARGEHGHVFVATEDGTDVYRCIDMAVHKLGQQLRRKKTRERDNKY